MSKFVGVDYGVRKLSVAAFTPDRVEVAPEVFSCFWNKKMDRDQILVEALNVVGRDLQHMWEDATMVCIEYPFMLRNQQTAIRMSMMAGTLMATLNGLTGLKAVFVEPAKWKRQVVGFARADKEATMAFLRERYPIWNFDNDDEADALCLALHGYYAHDGQEPTRVID